MMIKTRLSYEYKWEDVQGNVIYTGGQMPVSQTPLDVDHRFCRVAVTDMPLDSVEGFFVDFGSGK